MSYETPSAQKRVYVCRLYAVRAALRRRQSDLPRRDGTGGGARDAPRTRRVLHHGRRSAAPRRRRDGTIGERRPLCHGQEGRQWLRLLLYLRALPRDRASLCDPAYCYRLLSGGHRPLRLPGGAKCRTPHLFPELFRRYALLLLPPVRHSDMGGQGAHTALFILPRHPHLRRRARSNGRCDGAHADRCLRIAQLLQGTA